MRHSLEIGAWYDQARYSKFHEKISDILSWRGYGPFPVPVEVGLSCCSASKGRCTRHYIETELQSLSPQGGERSISLCFFLCFFWGWVVVVAVDEWLVVGADPAAIAGGSGGGGSVFSVAIFVVPNTVLLILVTALFACSHFLFFPSFFFVFLLVCLHFPD